ncbi:MAG: EF2563 family selenium-dependent molybdenum hydroxylase system protein [Deltaproteobacteria bacterium]|jgi:xanthine dehydrogenase accessory factor|nr:EF2563 family selenium-dependent molybdenum hydroxylase system protein [Deltaproteobacteria bacterium]MBW2530916.1 EF2563 family selenium-dependent molybdenum hydroxylase system protein [Deltaproteobacteria bacterium]
MSAPLVLIRGGGELGTGVGHALARAGAQVVVLDRPLPSALRLGVCFASAALEGRVTVAGVTAVHCDEPGAVSTELAAGHVALFTGDEVALALRPDALVDARMRRLTEPLSRRDEAPVVVGIGPGFEAGGDVDYVVESNRGPHLGQVVREGAAEAHTGIPGDVEGRREERILRSPAKGRLERVLGLGDFVEQGDVAAYVDGAPVRARLRGMIRGLKLTGVAVGAGHKVGDVDPRRDRELLRTMTDKAQAVGRGAVEALRLAALL